MNEEMMTHEENFQKMLLLASYHLAADYGDEYKQGYARIDDCAKLALSLGWSEEYVREVGKPSNGLATTRDVINKMKLLSK